MRLLLILACIPAFAAINGTAHFSIRSGSTSGNVNGALFDPAASFTLNDGVGASATGATPTFSSATYCFVSGDVGHKLYTVSNSGGGNTIVRGWWPITAVNSCVATLDAGTGNATYHVGGGRVYQVSLTNGIASTAAPTNIVFGVDYSQGTAAICAITDLAIDATTNTDVTSAACPFGPNHIGNGIRVASGTGFTVQLAWIQSIQSGSKARLDVSAGTTSSTAGVAKLGGSFSMNSSSAPNDDSVFELGVSGCEFWVQGSATYTINTVTISAAGSTTSPIRIRGYASVRGDDPVGSTRPIFNVGSGAFTLASHWQIHHMEYTGTVNGVIITSGVNNLLNQVKSTNTSTNTNLNALTSTGQGVIVRGVELVSYRGRGAQVTSASFFMEDSVVHDSNVGIQVTTSAAVTILNSQFYNFSTTAIHFAAAITLPVTVANCTIYGQANQLGTGILFDTGTTTPRVRNSIVAGFATGIQHADSSQTSGIDANNILHNNGTNVNGWVLSKSSRTDVDPGFTNVTQITGTSASSTTNVITAGSGSPFTNVVDGVDFVTITAGSGTGFPGTLPVKFLITAHDPTTITVSSNLTSSGSGSGIAWAITQGHNYAVGTGPKGLGAPGLFPRGFTTSYVDVGAVQRQETSGGGQRIQ